MLREGEMTSDLSTTAAGARPGFTTMTAYAQVPDVDRFVAFARDVFGAREESRTSGSAGGVHCELRIGDSMLMVGGPAAGHSVAATQRHVAMHVYVSDVDAVYQRAVDAGAEPLGAPRDEHFGERAGYVRDFPGNEWYIATHIAPCYSELRTLTPTLRGSDAAAFIDFLEAALGATLDMRADDPEAGGVRHAVLRVGDAAIELGEAHGPWAALLTGIYLYVADCDALYRRAVAAGATPVHPPADMPHGDRMGTIEDPWGNQWYVATHLGGAKP